MSFLMMVFLKIVCLFLTQLWHHVMPIASKQQDFSKQITSNLRYLELELLNPRKHTYQQYTYS